MKLFQISPELRSQLFKLSIPIIIQNVINQCLGLADTFMVGGVDQAALSGVTLANAVFFIVQLFIFGIQSGMCVLISQYYGKRDFKTLNRVLGVGMFAAGSVSTLVAIVIAIFPEQVFSLTSNNPILIDYAARYARIVAFSYVLNSLTWMYIGAQRSMGNPKLGMYVLITSMIINTGLNYVLIYGALGFPAMGVEGAAIATLIARFIEFAITYIYAFRNTEFILMPKLLLKPGKLIVKDFTRYTLPVVLNETLWGTGFSLYTFIMGHMPGSEVGLFAYSIAMSIERLAAGFFFGIGNAVGILIGNRLGTHDHTSNSDEIYAESKTMLAYTVLAGIFAGFLLIVLLFGLMKPFMFGMFNADAVAIDLTTKMIFILSSAMAVKSINYVIIVGILRGGGDVKFCLKCDLISMFAVAIPLAMFVGFVLKLSILWVFAVMAVEELWKIFFTIPRFRSKIWINNVTREVIEEAK